VAAAAVVGFLFKPAPEPRVLRTSILPPENVRFNLRGIHPGPVAMSPDGERIVFTGRQAGGSSLLFVRELDATEARAIPGTDDAGYPFWSPDGRSIGFFANGKLRRVDLTGGPPLTLCDASVGKGGTWSLGGNIVFAPSFNTPIHKVPDIGGVSEPITEVVLERGDNSHRFPWLLPDDEHFIYFARGGGEASTIRVGAMAGGFDKEIMRATSNAIYASGHLLFLRESTLMARPFDLASLEFSGDPVPVGTPVRYIPGAMWGIFTASQEGLLLFQSGASAPGARIVWRDFKGEEMDALEDVAQQDQLSVSPDGTQLVVDLFDNVGGTADLWIYDVARRIRTRFTFDPTNDQSGIFSPDGSRIVFASNRGGAASLYVKSVGGASNEEILVASDTDAYPTAWSPDGRYVVYMRTDTSATGDLWMVPLDGSEPRPLLDSRYGEYSGRLSPDGHWLAYVSDESGQMEVYVTSFPTPGRKWQISSGGGTSPEWGPRGDGIFYVGSNTFHFVETEEKGGTFAVGTTRNLFESNTVLSYRVLPTGDQFVLLEDADEGSVSPLTLVTDWPADLAKRGR